MMNFGGANGGTVTWPDGLDVNTMATANSIRSLRKNIPANERLIFAIDSPTVEDAKKVIDTLGDSVSFYKLGLEVLMAGIYHELTSLLLERKKKVFADIKMFDIPETVRRAVVQARNQGVSFATVHFGNDDLIKLVNEEKGDVKILIVTVLTSLTESDLQEQGFQPDIKKLVLQRARRAFKLGCDGVISSGLEAQELRNSLGQEFIIVVPGIRPVGNRDDHRRTVDVEEAFRNGADYIVVGRPIKNASNPAAAAAAIQKRIHNFLEST